MLLRTVAFASPLRSSPLSLLDSTSESSSAWHGSAAPPCVLMLPLKLFGEAYRLRRNLPNSNRVTCVPFDYSVSLQYLVVQALVHVPQAAKAGNIRLETSAADA